MSHLNKVIVVGAVIFLTMYGMENWWSSLFIVLYMYYFAFVANLFRKQYSKENRLTKLFFGLNEMPLIVAGIMIATFIIVVGKRYPNKNFDGAYLNAFIGATATTIARFKRGKTNARTICVIC
ncbi:MAG TPA: hypothetical protein VIT44_17080 [Cyclobacteriaceae bacterium]